MMQDLEPLEDISDEIVQSILETTEEDSIEEEHMEEIITCCLEWLDDCVKSNIKLWFSAGIRDKLP